MTRPAFEGWSAYRDSVVDVHLEDGVVTIGSEGVVSGQDWVPASAAFVITAYNPGRAVDPAVNEAAQGALQNLLGRRGITWLPAVGRSRDGAWQEPSVAVLGISEDEAIGIGRAFHQEAIFSWDGQRLRVLSCA